MSEFLSTYCRLISSPEQLNECRNTSSVFECLQVIKKLWNRGDLTDEQLLKELDLLNRVPIDHSNIVLAKNWLPYRYLPKSRRIDWCLPEGHATEAFQDEYISHCRQSLVVNQLIQPCTSLDTLTHQASNIPVAHPAGFIFHLSRCGSTLISGCLSELDTSCVFSESPLLTEILLDTSLTHKQKQTCLQQCINLQASVFPARPDIIIKWNAWDIFHWHMIRGVYPDVPVIFLVRNPSEILTSHYRSAGRHMSGDTSLVSVNPVFSAADNFVSLFNFRVQILKSLMLEMLKRSDSARVVDYQQLHINTIRDIASYMGIDIDSGNYLKIQNRMQFHSKLPGKKFQGDGGHSIFSSVEYQNINQDLSGAYHELLNFVKEIEHVA